MAITRHLKTTILYILIYGAQTIANIVSGTEFRQYGHDFPESENRNESGAFRWGTSRQKANDVGASTLHPGIKVWKSHIAVNGIMLFYGNKTGPLFQSN